jgi:hypothetical protein
MDERDDQEAEQEIHITTAGIGIPFWDGDGFGRVEVTLQPGERETVTVNGRKITVIRDYLH